MSKAILYNLSLKQILSFFFFFSPEAGFHYVAQADSNSILLSQGAHHHAWLLSNILYPETEFQTGMMTCALSLSYLEG
jgi:hypothetical protein